MRILGSEIEVPPFLGAAAIAAAELVRADPLVGHVRVADYRHWRGGAEREAPGFVCYRMPVELHAKLKREEVARRVKILDQLDHRIKHASVVALFRESRLWFAGKPEDVELFLRRRGWLR